MNKVFFVVGCVRALTNSLADCNTFAALFDNTCTAVYDVADWPTSTSKTLNCVGPNSCVGSDGAATYSASISNECTHQVRLCVTCTQTTSVFIRVQTNSMPNNCYSTNTVNNISPKYYNWDWEVEWNTDVYGTFQQNFANYQSQIDDAICHNTNTKVGNIQNFVDFYQGADIENAIGITKGNMLIFNALTDYAQDTIDTDLFQTSKFLDYFDNCLAYIAADQYLAIHSLSPCKGSPSATVPGAVTLTDYTTQLETTFTSAYTTTTDYGGILGLAKDGHIIVGPYNGLGEIWNCDDVDYCNGFFMDDTSYAYASTIFFPYTVGCWGPANGQSTLKPSCSTNSCLSIVGISVNLIGIVAYAMFTLS